MHFALSNSPLVLRMGTQRNFHLRSRYGPHRYTTSGAVGCGIHKLLKGMGVVF